MTLQVDFHGAVAKYRQLKMEYENHPAHDVSAADPSYAQQEANVSELRRELDDTFGLVLRLPSPDAAAIATKLELLLIEHEGFEFPEGDIRKISRDAARLGAIQAASSAEASA